MYSYKENYLIHFGVPGMKWGQRKARVSSGSGSTRTSGKKTTQQVKTARKSKLKTAAKIGAGLAAAGLAGVAGMKASSVLKNAAFNKMVKQGDKIFVDTLKRTGSASAARITANTWMDKYGANVDKNVANAARYLIKKRKVFY